MSSLFILSGRSWLHIHIASPSACAVAAGLLLQLDGLFRACFYAEPTTPASFRVERKCLLAAVDKKFKAAHERENGLLSGKTLRTTNTSYGQAGTHGPFASQRIGSIIGTIDPGLNLQFCSTLMNTIPAGGHIFVEALQS